MIICLFFLTKSTKLHTIQTKKGENGKENNKIINVFIESLLVFKIIILILIVIDEFLFRFGYIQTFVMKDFILTNIFQQKIFFGKF